MCIVYDGKKHITDYKVDNYTNLNDIIILINLYFRNNDIITSKYNNIVDYYTINGIPYVVIGGKFNKVEIY